MAQAGPQVITTRREFLIHARGATAAAAALALPVAMAERPVFTTWAEYDAARWTEHGQMLLAQADLSVDQFLALR